MSENLSEEQRDEIIRDRLVGLGLVPDAVEELVISRCRNEPHYREYIEELWGIGDEQTTS